MSAPRKYQTGYGAGKVHLGEPSRLPGRAVLYCNGRTVSGAIATEQPVTCALCRMRAERNGIGPEACENQPDSPCLHCGGKLDPDEASDQCEHCGEEIGREPNVDTVRARLEYLRGELRAERISWGELLELQNLTEYIEPGDAELLEAAGVPELEDDDSPTTESR